MHIGSSEGMVRLRQIWVTWSRTALEKELCRLESRCFQGQVYIFSDHDTLFDSIQLAICFLMVNNFWVSQGGEHLCNHNQFRIRDI